MSRKIRRIEECTEHILEYQKKHPDRASELHTFLDYYLPTTMKLLHAYAELEEQGVAGDNISTTKARIESTMDSVVQGFEAQLDKLFEGSMLDISADSNGAKTLMIPADANRTKAPEQKCRII